MSLMSDIATAIKNKFILNDFSSQSNNLLTGGGTISVSATWEVKWSTRFIAISNGRGAALATVGYFDIAMPAVSTVITGSGGATNKTVTANGIPLGAHETLYYILPLGAANTTVNANFRVCSYTADINIPNNWIKICSKNDEGGYVDFACGISLRNNTSINTHLYDVKGADVDGAVSSANTLATARTISASGDVVGTATSFNGSANITVPMTLATIVDSGTGLFKKITTNAKGLVTGTTNVVQSDIIGLLGSGSITNTMIANTAVNNLSGTNTGDQTITLTGDITGTGNGSFATALSNSGVTAGTYSKMTVDSKGRITAGFTQTMEDIPDATFKRSVKAATTANITLSGPQTVDGVALVAGDRVLVKNQTTTSQNGIYVVAAGAWRRSLDADSASEISSALVAVDTGTINGGKLFDNYFKTTDTLGTTAMVWSANLDDGALLTSGSTSIGIVKYNGTTAAAGQFDGGATTPTGSTRLNYGGYFYPTYVNLLGTADTATASSHVFVETASDGYVRPKTLANFKTEMFTSPAFTGAPTAPTATVNNNSNQIATTAYVASQVANTAVALTGNQTVDGIKTFSSSPIVPTPTTDLQVANKKYVDDKIFQPSTDYYQGAYGISWDYATDTYIRTGAKGYTAIQSQMKRCVVKADGTVNYYLNPENSNFKANGTPSVLTGADGNVMVEIPKHYIKVETVGNVDSFSISLTPEVGYVLDPAFLKWNGTSMVEVPYRYFRAYEGFVSGGKLLSVSGVTPTRTQTIDTFRTQAIANGAGWHLTDWNLLNTIKRLCYIEFCDFIVTKYLGNGNDTGTDYGITTGQSNNALGNRSSDSIHNYKYMSYRGIENMYADIWEFVDGVNVNNYQFYINGNYSTFQSDVFTGNYIAKGSLTAAAANSSLIKRCAVSADGGFIPTDVGGSTATFYGDALWSSTGAMVALYGGAAGFGASGGLGAQHVAAASSVSSASVGAAVCR